MIHHERIQVGRLEVTVSVEASERATLEIDLSVEPLSCLAETHLLRCRLRSTGDGPFSLDDLSFRWSVPAIDMHGLYAGPPSPEELTRLPFWQFQKRSAASTGFPFVSLFHRGGDNRFAFGLIDQLTETALDATLSEATRAYDFHWHKPLGSARLTAREWTDTLFISAAHRPWPEVLRAYVDAVDREWPQSKLPVPDCAYDPVFCTWTAIHHDVSQAWILLNARLAADLGFGTWLTDDGWFSEEGEFADYRHTGDWRPSPGKFPDFAGHVAQVQAMGLRYVLWIAPFMVGDASDAARRHAPLLTDPTRPLGYRNLSPRHAESRAVVGDLLERLVRDFRLDGLKIDFVDSIALDGEVADGDHQTVGEGVYASLAEAVDRVARLRPDVLIEFRNTYANLASRRYANLYRSSDVPINFAANRWQATMLRLLVPDRAVHLDPALWHPDDTDENVAVHLINVISSVPMISVELDRYPQSHLDLIRYWIGFYRRHRDTIVHGEFAPEWRSGQVPLIRFGGADETILGVYDDIAFALGAGVERAWVLNASTRPYVELLPTGSSGPRRVRTLDKFGQIVAEHDVVFPVARLPVEVGGSLEIEA
jgi:alpha-galactosidase